MSQGFLFGISTSPTHFVIAVYGGFCCYGVVVFVGGRGDLFWGFLGFGGGFVVPDKEHFGEKQGINQFW